MLLTETGYVRRIDELREKGQQVDAGQLTAELKERDLKDMSRTVGPLKKADNAVAIDSTRLSISEVVTRMLEHIRRGHVPETAN